MASANGNGTPGLDADYARCAEITRASSSNFYYAFMLLPAERRRALHAVYAFCRFIDDIADDESAGDAASLLSRWREELDRVYRGAPTHAISRATDTSCLISARNSGVAVRSASIAGVTPNRRRSARGK